MSLRLAISATAHKDLNKIWDFIALDSIDAADRVLHEIQTAMLKLCDMPGMGHRRMDVKDERIRIWSVYSYLIAYRHNSVELRIKRVVSGHRDIEKILGAK